MFLHELALILGITMREMNSLHYDEIRSWQEYFRRRPPEWKQDHRASLILSAIGVKDSTSLFPSLEAVNQDSQEQINAKKFTKSIFFGKFQEMIDGSVSGASARTGESS